ncbi:MAG: hypothetical protein UHN02_01245 [Acutalibacteraceae bacterium]|nr:hypothetical protein [Acutalibacteraceae bacterium]
MTNYTMSDWARMQTQAENRIKNTNEHNRNAVINSNKNKNGILSFLNFDKIDLNKDTSTILMLLALLGKDGEQDDLLMLALLYIML